jgi:hypothetical protein
MATKHALCKSKCIYAFEFEILSVKVQHIYGRLSKEVLTKSKHLVIVS